MNELAKFMKELYDKSQDRNKEMKNMKLEDAKKIDYLIDNKFIEISNKFTPLIKELFTKYNDETMNLTDIKDISYHIGAITSCCIAINSLIIDCLIKYNEPFIPLLVNKINFIDNYFELVKRNILDHH